MKLIRMLVAGALVAGATITPALGNETPADLPGCGPRHHAGGDWRMSGHDHHNTRFQPDEDVIGPAEAATLEPAFTFSSVAASGDAAAGDFTGTPVVADGCVYMGSNGGWVFAFNADTGEKAWATKLPQGGTMPGSPVVQDGRVYVGVNLGSGSYAAALDQATGTISAESAALDTQTGHDVLGSPTLFDADPDPDAYDPHLFVGISGWGAESDFSPEGTVRYAFDGSFVILDADDLSLAKKTFTVTGNPNDGHAGCGIWSTAAFDARTSRLYVGTSNPFKPENEHPHCNAILKIDADASSATFGSIVDSYKATDEEYVNHYVEQWPCVSVPGAPRVTPSQEWGTCPDMDLAVGASPTLFPHSDGRTLVGVGQKSGIYHAADTTSMERVWARELGIPTLVGGIVGSAAFDGSAIYGPHTAPGYTWSVGSDDGSPRWIGAHGPVSYGNSVTVANGVVYTTDQKHFLNAWDAETGVQVLARRIDDGSDAAWRFSSTQGSVAVARNTVYVAVGTNGTEPGYIVGFRPGGAS